MAMCLLARDVYYLELGVSSINSNKLQGRDVRIGTEQLFRGCRYVCPRGQDVCGVEESDPAGGKGSCSPAMGCTWMAG